MTGTPWPPISRTPPSRILPVSWSYPCHGGKTPHKRSHKDRQDKGTVHQHLRHKDPGHPFLDLDHYDTFISKSMNHQLWCRLPLVHFISFVKRAYLMTRNNKRRVGEGINLGSEPTKTRMIKPKKLFHKLMITALGRNDLGYRNIPVSAMI